MVQSFSILQCFLCLFILYIFRISASFLMVCSQFLPLSLFVWCLMSLCSCPVTCAPVLRFGGVKSIPYRQLLLNAITRVALLKKVFRNDLDSQTKQTSKITLSFSTRQNTTTGGPTSAPVAASTRM